MTPVQNIRVRNRLKVLEDRGRLKRTLFPQRPEEQPSAGANVASISPPPLKLPTNRQHQPTHPVNRPTPYQSPGNSESGAAAAVATTVDVEEVGVDAKGEPMLGNIGPPVTIRSDYVEPVPADSISRESQKEPRGPLNLQAYLKPDKPKDPDSPVFKALEPGPRYEIRPEA